MVIGFIDDTGRRLPFDRVGEGEWGWKREIVLSMAAQEQKGQVYVGDMTVTRHITPPLRLTLLRQRYDYYIDPMSVADLYEGGLLHKELSMYNGALREHVLTTIIHGATLSGKIDNYTDSWLKDFKSTKNYTYTKCSEEMMKPKPIAERHEYFRQLYTYIYLLEVNGYPVSKASIIMSLKDWSATSWQSQPPGRYSSLDIPIPEKQAIEDWLFDKVETYLVIKPQPDDALPMCTDEERYGKNKDGSYKRCKYYCDVRPFCEAIASREQFEWEKGFMACVNLLTPPSKGAVMEILLQNFNVQDPAELRFRFQWQEVWSEIKRRK